MSVEIIAVSVLNDNYVWLAHDEASGETVVIDPAVAQPILDAASERGWTITQIWNTHWHPDHVGGNAEIKAATGCRITGPHAEAAKIETLDVLVEEGDQTKLGAFTAEVWDVPAHTAGHIAYYLPEAGAIFVGDTLFAMGCGRLFEGKPEQMFANMQRFATLDGETQVYCAHEYTLSNAKFALSVDAGNEDLVHRAANVQALRDRGEATVPTTIALERATNPFMRAGNVEEFARLRAAKDAA